MKLGILFSGGKDSAFASYLAKKEGNELICLISIISKNPESFMFHTPSIKEVEKQAKVMDLPILTKKTEGKKEEELKDLENVIKKAKEKFNIEGIVTGAVASTYQASRIQKICDKLKLKCINPLWHIDSEEYWDDLFKNNFEIVITGVACEGLTEGWLGKTIDKKVFLELKKLSKKFKFHLAFEGGEAETFVTNCPLFKKRLKIVKSKKIMDNEFSGCLEIQEVGFV